MIRLELPWLPPSSNHAYMNSGFGGRTLSAEGRKFKTLTQAHLVQKYPRELKIFQKDKPYLLLFRFYFQEVETKGFATGKAKNRYKTFDGGNRTKLLEDALKEVGGIDDAQTMTSLWQKAQGSPERTVLWAWSLEEEKTPFDEILTSLV